METKQYKAGMTVDVLTNSDRFDYVLKKDDIEDINRGEWEEVGFKIISIKKQRNFFLYPLRQTKKAFLKSIKKAFKFILKHRY